MSRSTRPGRRGRQGVSARVLALSMLVLCGFVALVIDVGYARLVRAELQVGVDAAAIGAARVLDGTADGLENARSAAAAPSAAWATDHVDAIIACMNQWFEDGTIDDACAPITPGSSVNLGSGADTSALLAGICLVPPRDAGGDGRGARVGPGAAA